VNALAAALRGALDLVTPTACAGCGRVDAVVCEQCAAALFDVPRRADLDAPLLRAGPPTWAAAPYTGTTRQVVLAWKAGREDLHPLMREAVAGLVDRWASLGEAPAAGTVGVVPAPSGWVRRARGLVVTRQMAEVVATTLDRPGLRATVTDVVRRRGHGHLAGLWTGARAAARRTNLRVHAVPAVDCWVLVDDVVTSGATLAATAAALEAASRRAVSVAFVLAATPRRSGDGLPGM